MIVEKKIERETRVIRVKFFFICSNCKEKFRYKLNCVEHEKGCVKI